MSNKHKDLTAEHNHIVQSLEYANETARTNASGFTSADIGRIARQTDTGSFYILKSLSPLVWAATEYSGDNHSHLNKAVLDKLGEEDGSLTYDGDPVGGGGSGSTSDTSWTGSNFSSTTASPSQRVLQEALKNVGVDTLASNLIEADNNKIIEAVINGYNPVTSGGLSKWTLQNVLTDSFSSITLTNSGLTFATDSGRSGNYVAVADGSSYATFSPVDAPAPSGAAARTLCGWLKTSASATEFILSYGTTSAGNEIGIGVFSDGKPYVENYGTEIFGTGTINDNLWHHLAVTYDGTTARIYVDGTLNNSGALTLNTGLSWGNVGSVRNGTNKFTGRISDCRIYNRALSAGEIESLYNNETGGSRKYAHSAIKTTDLALLSGNQTVAGVKTFSSSPIVPTPTTDMQAATKKYVDEHAGTASAGITVLPKTDNYTTSSDFGKLIIFTSSTAAAKTLTLETMSSKNGSAPIYVKNESSYNITIDANGSETIDGQLTLILEPGQSLKIVSDGTNARTF